MPAEKSYHQEVQRISDGVRNFFNRAFDEIIIQGPPLEHGELAAFPTMVTSTHRSHADYMLLGSVLHSMGLPNLRFIAGDNLTELPYLGKNFKKWGAVPVKRAKTMGRAYLLELAEQVASMILDGDNILVFPEGGRSYSGSLLEIKNGILAAQVLNQYRHPEKNFVFFPIAVSYEQLPEVLFFKMLKKGKEVRSQATNPLTRGWGSLLYFGADIIAFIKFLNAYRWRKTYGRIYIDYDRPIPLSQIADVQKEYIQGSRDDFSGLRRVMQKSGETLYRKLRGLYRVLPMHVLAAALLDSREMAVLDAAAGASRQRDLCLEQGRNGKSIESLGEGELFEQGLIQLKKLGAVRVSRSRIRVIRPEIIRYYAATCRPD